MRKRWVAWLLICAISFSIPISASAATIRDNPKKLVRLVRKEVREVASWRPKIKRLIDRDQLFGNCAVSYYRFTGRENCKKASRSMIKDVIEAKTLQQYPSDVFYLHYDGKKKKDGSLVYRYSLYQTSRKVLANRNGIPGWYR